MASGTVPSTKRRIGEWVVIGKPSRWRPMSNGLQYKVWKMERHLVPGSFGRGKCYDLEDMPDEERSETEKRLMRHPAICDRIGRHPAIPTNKHAGFEGKDHFWIIDVWEEGRSLAEVLDQGPLESGLLPQVMREIAEGLQVLHKNGIARRELTPEFVSLRASDHSVLLTDLELARVLDGSPPTPVNWKENPYVAPEVFSGRVDKRADLFSWGQILYHASTGQAPPKLPGTGLFDPVELPPSVRRIATECVSVSPSMRPRGIGKVVKAVRSWR
jgi:serine/threonine protein kinase